LEGRPTSHGYNLDDILTFADTWCIDVQKFLWIQADVFVVRIFHPWCLFE
jgi:hypothetical protein